MRAIVRIIVPVLILVIGIFSAGYMLSTPQRAARAAQPEQEALVQVMQAPPVSEPVIITAQGNVLPSMQVQLRPEVAGRIVEIDRRLVPGGVFRAGEFMARLDQRDYQINIEAQKERIADAVYRLKLEQGQAAVAQQEWDLLGESVPSTPEGRELALRKPQIEKAEASVKAAESALEKARLDLARTEIKAPFNAVVLRESVDLGQVVNNQSEIAQLVGTDQFWIQVLVPVEDLSHIDIPGVNATTGSRTRVVQESGRQRIVREGRVLRLLSDLEQAGRMARLIVAVDDPLLQRGARGGELPLLLGAYVTVEITGRQMDGIHVIPRSALRDGNESAAGADLDAAMVWIVGADDRLAFREVRVAWLTNDTAYVSEGLSAEDRIVTSTLAVPIVGLKLRVETPEAAARVGM